MQFDRALYILLNRFDVNDLFTPRLLYNKLEDMIEKNEANLIKLKAFGDIGRKINLFEDITFERFHKFINLTINAYIDLQNLVPLITFKAIVYVYINYRYRHKIAAKCIYFSKKIDKYILKKPIDDIEFIE